MSDEELEFIVIEGVEPPPLTETERKKYELITLMRQMEADDITPRFQREFNIENARIIAQANGITLEQLAASSAGLQKLIERDNEFRALRKQYLEL